MDGNNKNVRFIVQMLRYTEIIQDQTGKGAGSMEHRIVWVRGHVEVYDPSGRFCFSADSEREAREELAEIV